MSNSNVKPLQLPVWIRGDRMAHWQDNLNLVGTVKAA